MRALVLAAALAVATAGQAATLIDFGTDAGQTNSSTTGFSIWGGWGFAHSRTFAADYLDISYPVAAAQWQGAGEQYRGGYFNGVNLNNVDTSGKLALEARVILGTPAPDFYIFTMTLYAADGGTARYDFINSVRATPTPFSYGTDPASVPFTVVQATTDLAHPTVVAGGGFTFGSDTLAGMDILYQSGISTSGGTVNMQIDNVQFPTVPEPTVVAGLAISSLGLMLRKRQK